MKYMIVIAGLIGCMTSSAFAQLPSVLVTPRVELDVQQVQQAPVQQAPAPQVYYIQPQAQPAQQQACSLQNYLRFKMWYDAHYEQRGILFPRTVRRRAGDPQTVLYHILMTR